MKPPTEQLLDDLLEEAAPAEFRAALLGNTLRQARRRQRIRRVSTGAGMAVLVVAFTAVFLRDQVNSKDRVSPIAQPAGPTDLNIVESRPLDPSQIVRTGPGSARLVVLSDLTLNAFAVVRTEPSIRTYVEITDQQLLALLSGRQVSLVRHGPHEAELIFQNPEDAKELFLP